MVTLPVHAGGQGDNENDVPPIYVAGARVVDVRGTDGSLHRYTTIPTTSVFLTHGSSECTFTATAAGRASDGTAYMAGQVVHSSRWMFVEGLPPALGEANPVDHSSWVGPLREAVRYFVVFCDSWLHPLALISVSSRDPMLDPRRQVSTVRNDLQLTAPVLVDDPVIGRWSSLITRHPTWLAIDPAAWRSHVSTRSEWRGWRMYLLADPRSLSFLVVYRPSAASASAGVAGWTEVVPCISVGESAVSAATRVPRRPALGSPQPPGVNGPCTVTAPAPGVLEVTPIEEYDVVFWANGYTETLDPYWWAGQTVTYPVGDLSSVNVAP